jgi:hypothetical protein
MQGIAMSGFWITELYVTTVLPGIDLHMNLGVFSSSSADIRPDTRL